jgi:hypothetical protein
MLQDNAGYHTMTTGKDDLTKATQLGTKTGQGNWTGLYLQWEFEQNILLTNGTTINGYEAQLQCMKNKTRATSTGKLHRGNAS